jgi:hypothetical protein
MYLSRPLPFVCLVLAAVSVLASSSVAAAGGKGHDLPADEKLRIGIKHRPEVCIAKAKSGDQLSMHYTGTLYKVSVIMSETVLHS